MKKKINSVIGQMSKADGNLFVKLCTRKKKFIVTIALQSKTVEMEMPPFLSEAI